MLDSLKTAVDRRRVADVPVGVLLSGGLDSSLVVALLADGGTANNLKTFSIGFDSVGDVVGDEFCYSDLIATRFATDHHRIRIDPAKAACRGILAARELKPQAVALASARAIDCVWVDLDVLRGLREPELTLFA